MQTDNQVKTARGLAGAETQYSEDHQPRSPYQDSALHVQRYLRDNLWRDGVLVGPDPGVRFNYRIFRFIKSSLPALPWKDGLVYEQGQGYWVLGNWLLAERTGRSEFRDMAVQASDQMLARQRPDGAWDYPNPEWHGRVANAEGSWAAIGLLASHRRTGERRYLDAALRWWRYLVDGVGFQRDGEQLAVNYFGQRGGARVPNNTAFVLHFLADLADATGDTSYRDPCRGMLAFMAAVQMRSGEFPYALKGEDEPVDHVHYQCFQYNAFQAQDLMRYWELTGDEAALPLIRQVLSFLRQGLAPDGHARYECGDDHRAVTYHAAALGAAFSRASQLGIGDYLADANRAFGYVMRRQRANGSFPHSRGDYRLLGDERAYPRYLAMIMYHLLVRDGLGQTEPVPLKTQSASEALHRESDGEQPLASYGLPTAARKPRVLVIGPLFPQGGGVGTVDQTLLQCDLGQRYDMQLLDTGRGRAGHGKEGALAPLNFYYYLRQAARLLGILAFRRPQIVHQSLTDSLAFWKETSFMVLARAFGVKVVAHVHGNRLEIQYRESSPRMQRLMRRALSVPHVLVALSEHWRVFLAEVTTPPARLVVVPNSVDPSVAQAMDEARRPVVGSLTGPTAPDACLVLFMGGVGVRKGVHDALRAVPLVRQQVPEARFVFAGPPAAGQEGESLLRAGQAPEMGGAVDFPGMVTGAAKLDLLARASIFILPSYQENLPVALLEAMAMGLPVVTTPVAGIPDMVEEGRNGFLVPVGDYEGLAERIVRLAKDPALRQSMGEANVARVRQEYHPARFARRIADVYRGLLDRPSVAGDSARRLAMGESVQDDVAGSI